MAFTSSATDAAGWYRDLANHTMEQRHKGGVTSPALGVQHPLDTSGIQDAAGYGKFIDNINAFDTVTRGPAYHEGMGVKYDNYAERRYAAVSSGGMPRNVVDDKGTIGYGLNINDPASNVKMAAALGEGWEEYRDGKKALGSVEQRKLFDADIQEYENKLTAANPSLNERQRSGLLALIYNNKEAWDEDLQTAVKSGDDAAIHEAILWGGDGSPAGVSTRLRASMAYGGMDKRESPMSFSEYTVGREKAMTARGLRNNNPLNIDASKNNKWQGQTGSDGRFAQFQAPEHGIRAAAKLLGNYHKLYGLNTVSGLVGRWAPENENDTKNYARFVAKQMGIDPNMELDMTDKAMMAKMVKAMITMENGSNPYSDDQINNGVGMA